MNLVLFDATEIDSPLALDDPRARHLLEVLRRAPGEPFEIAQVNGPRGSAMITSRDARALHLALTWLAPTAPPPRPTLIVALPRPQTARDILRDATTVGVSRIDFVTTERADANYAASRLWTTGEWRRHLLTGAAQACDPHLPAVTWHHSLATALAARAPATPAVALDLYEAEGPWDLAPLDPGADANATPPPTVVIGPERGWSAADRTVLRATGCRLLHLGPRALRTETAVVAALVLLNRPRPPA